jgi:serine/threonine protein phosphatase PrpC
VNHDRVNGSLAMSRAFGDFIFKQNEDLLPEEQAVSCKPEVHHRDISTPYDEFMVLASDGVWEVLDPQQVVDFVRPRLAKKQNIQSIAMDLLDECITDDVMNEEGIGCDNITCTIVILLHDTNGKTSLVTDAEPIKKQSYQKKNKSKVNDENDLDLNLDPSVSERLAERCMRPKLAPERLPKLLIYQ